MKAVQITGYNKEIKTEIKNINIPEINDNQVLIKVKAAAVNPLDLLVIKGEIKLIQDYKMPVTLGNECSGIIEKTGIKVKNFKTGDKVYVRLPQKSMGAFAEYVAVDEEYIAKIPKNYSYSQASASALAGLTIYQALTEEFAISSNKTILITGGSGSFGHIAVPVAKSFGLNVIVTGNSRSKDKIIQLGADKYIDYTKENYWEVLSNIDCVIDTLGINNFKKSLSVLKSGGTLISLKGIPNKEFAVKNNMPFLKKLLFSIAGKKFDKIAKKENKTYKFLFVKANGYQLQKITEIIEKINITPQIDEHIFTLEQTNDALKLLNKGGINGKIIIKIDD